MLDSSSLSRQILDVRTHSEFLRGHLPGAIHIPMEKIIDRYAELRSEVPYCIICDHGVRSLVACDFLQSKGFDVINFPGGMSILEGKNKPNYEKNS